MEGSEKKQKTTDDDVEEEEKGQKSECDVMVRFCGGGMCECRGKANVSIAVFNHLRFACLCLRVCVFMCHE